MPQAETAQKLTELALALEDAQNLEQVCAALEKGRLTQVSSAATRAAIAGGSIALEERLRHLADVWASNFAHLSGEALALILRCSANSAQQMRQRLPIAEVVWSGPKIEHSFLRATREVVRELLREARNELLIVGYWIAAKDDGEGIIEEFIASLAEAVLRRIKCRVVLDERVRPDGKDNLRILTSAWPVGVPLPELFTWRLPQGDQHLKLHAKVLVTDRRDALVTSANFTFYAMDRNMEMGVRVIGSPAADIARHFDLLVANGILERFAGT